MKPVALPPLLQGNPAEPPPPAARALPPPDPEQPYVRPASPSPDAPFTSHVPD